MLICSVWSSKYLWFKIWNWFLYFGKEKKYHNSWLKGFYFLIQVSGLQNILLFCNMIVCAAINDRLWGEKRVRARQCPGTTTDPVNLWVTGNILQGTFLTSSSLIKETLSYIDELHFWRCYISYLLLLPFKLHTHQKRSIIRVFKCALPLSSPTGHDVISVKNNIK